MLLLRGTYPRASMLFGSPVSDFLITSHEMGHVLTRRSPTCSGRRREECARAYQNSFLRDIENNPR